MTPCLRRQNCEVSKASTEDNLKSYFPTNGLPFLGGDQEPMRDWLNSLASLIPVNSASFIL